MRLKLAAAIALATVALAGCRAIPKPQVTPPPVASSAAAAGVAAGPAIASLGIAPADASSALASFRESCPRLLARDDVSGLAPASSWEPACTAARGWGTGDPLGFFDRYFETARIADGAAFATGYYEPEIRGSRQRIPGYDQPVYAPPPELVRGWWDTTPEGERTGKQQLGRYDAAGKFVPYYDRAEIMAGALANRGLEIAWIADPIEFFFLQVQGSGRLRAPDGSVMRIGYAGQNGRGYTGIGRTMKDRGQIGAGTPYATSMQGIMGYLRDRPAEAQGIMNENQSWIFFKELTGDGPLGSLSVPVRRESSVAADPSYVPLGAPVWLDMDRPEADGLWIAQDTGGAIKGANRFDTFWGAGEDARTIAGGMSARGKALLFLPKGTVARLKGK